jgi:hypothetical protein
MLLLLLRGLMIRPLLLPVPVGALLAAAVLATATAVRGVVVAAFFLTRHLGSS